MKKEIYFGMIFLAAIALILATGCMQKTESMPEDFSIYYSFGVGEKNILDTKNNLYTKDMFLEEPRVYQMELSKAEKKEIFDAVMENGLLSIKNDLTQNCNSRQCMTIEPISGATLKLTMNGETKTIVWDGGLTPYDPDDPELKKFLAVKQVIYNIIKNKEIEMNIPQAKGGWA